ncbi:hypothetical protein [Actinomadura chokoriensis]|uniref:Uncharacterized protein n=1 Tax=Actinomadura chokoriensis TaxID=454156 RepID=A0ABV4R2G7_9ACTN
MDATTSSSVALVEGNGATESVNEGKATASGPPPQPEQINTATAATGQQNRCAIRLPVPDKSHLQALDRLRASRDINVER